MRKEDRRSDWHLDMRFSLGIIIAILAQCASFIWYGSKLDSRVENQGNTLLTFATWREHQEEARVHIESRLAGVDEQLKSQSQTLSRIDNNLDRVLNRVK